jgi:L-seryl-tRNA(Ser) seleniumtransferase
MEVGALPAPNESLLRTIPSVDALLQDDSLREWAERVPRAVVVECVRASVEEARQALLVAPPQAADEAAVRRTILASARRRLGSAALPYYRRAINATGIILHTGLGRAVLPADAVRRIGEELSGYSLLQLDVETGKRSRREARIEQLLQHLTGAEAATLVNNNAAATMLVLNTVAAGKEVIVSRGQLVEIGGAFRLPDVMETSGARMVEVGTTNRTHLRDYERAVTENTAAILRVHPSNYQITGFTSEVPLSDLVALGRRCNLVVIDDVGAGSLIDFSRFGFTKQPTLPESIRTGADLTTSSGDKLMGASQAGIILGRRDLVDAVRRNPIARAMRVGKLTLSVLETTLSLFLDEERALREVPTLAMVRRAFEDIGEQAERIASAIRNVSVDFEVAVRDGSSQMGSGSLPGEDLPTRLVTVRARHVSADELALRLRRAAPPVFTRIQNDEVCIDPRTLRPGDEDELVAAVRQAFAAGQ